MSPHSLYLYYWLDPNLPSALQSWARTGASNWIYSPANVYLFSVNSLSAADIEVDAWNPGAACGGTWGLTSHITNPNLPGNPIKHMIIQLNVDNYYNCNNYGGAVWISTAAHEFGHSFGLDHNDWVDPATGHHMLMWSCSACTSSQQTPQSMDLQIINTMYSWNLIAPTHYTLGCPNWPGWSYQYDDHAYNAPGSPSQAGLNTWYAPSRGNGNGTECNGAYWAIDNVSNRCVNLLFWDSWYNSWVTYLQVDIQSAYASGYTWHDYVVVNEAPTWNYINLGNYPYAQYVEVYDNQAGTGTNGGSGGATFAVGPIQTQWC